MGIRDSYNGDGFAILADPVLPNEIVRDALYGWTPARAITISGHPPESLSLHHCLTFHGSTANSSGRLRRSFAIHLRTQNSRPVNDERKGLTRFIDDEKVCPIIFGS